MNAVVPTKNLPVSHFDIHELTMAQQELLGQQLRMWMEEIKDLRRETQNIRRETLDEVRSIHQKVSELKERILRIEIYMADHEVWAKGQSGRITKLEGREMEALLEERQEQTDQSWRQWLGVMAGGVAFYIADKIWRWYSGQQ